MNTKPLTSLCITQEEAWQAVLSRDPLLDGQFVYAVRTTGVFCRPTCGSRRPHRRNVEFYGTPEDAVTAGYRACQRCSPETSSDRSSRLLEEMLEYIDQHLDEKITLDKLARHMDLSPWHVQRTFKKLAGVSPRAYVSMRRTERMKASLRNGDTVSRAIYDAGFNSSSVVYEASSGTLGMTPAEYRKGGAGVQIQYVIAPCQLGMVLVAATERGVCSLAFGDDEGALGRKLRDEYPKATVERSFGGFEDWITQVTNFLEGTSRDLAIPLHIGGSQFQERVWNALRSIPYGETRTYADLAREVGAPSAVRAVANACGANRAAVVIPCHRVVRSDGGLGGYKWGLPRKKALLDTERRNSARNISE